MKGPVLLGGVPLLLEELDGVHGGKGGVGLRDGAVEDQAGGVYEAVTDRGRERMR